MHTITQQLVVDNEVLAVLVFHVERVADATRTAPAMELIGFQKYPCRGGAPPSSASSSSSFPFFASPSPPVSPTSPTFAHTRTYPSAPVSPQSPLFPRMSVPSGSGPEDVSTPMLYSYPPPQAFAYSYTVDPR